MIQAIMLLALGFLLATLIFLLLAPAVWRRAARLATKRLKSSLPISLTDFHAEKDQLRADHAIQIRGFEVNLELAKEKTAQQMVEIGRQRAENMTLTAQIRELRSALSERKSLISVMEQTLNANVPRMKERVESELGAKLAFSDQVNALEGELKKTTHQLEETDRDLKLREAEIHKLRQLRSAAPQAGAAIFSFKRAQKERDVQSGSPEKEVDLAALNLVEGEKAAIAVQALQRENGQLRDVISKTKAQLAFSKSFEAKEVPALRQEMRQLGTDIMRAATVPQKANLTASPAPAPAQKSKPVIDVNAGLRGAPASLSVKPVLNGKLTSSDLQRAKKSLADRLKNVTKAVREADA